MDRRKLAVMQPYVFPYIGYFQLISAVDIFVFYDDVNFIKQGWINRNKILLNGKEYLFSIPLRDVSSFRPINETEINLAIYDKWQKKFLKSLNQSYKKAPFFDETYALVKSVLIKNYSNIAEMNIESILLISRYLKLETEFVYSSEKFGSTKGLEKAERLFEISRKLKCTDYINPFGGIELYRKAHFSENGIELHFIKNSLTEYKQGIDNFVAGLSMIDVLMWNSKAEINEMLRMYSFV